MLFSKEKPSVVQMVKELLFSTIYNIHNSVNFEFLQVDFSSEWQSVFQRLAAAVSPIALVAVGLQLKIEKEASIGVFNFRFSI